MHIYNNKIGNRFFSATTAFNKNERNLHKYDSKLPFMFFFSFFFCFLFFLFCMWSNELYKQQNSQKIMKIHNLSTFRKELDPGSVKALQSALQYARKSHHPKRAIHSLNTHFTKIQFPIQFRPKRLQTDYSDKKQKRTVWVLRTMTALSIAPRETSTSDFLKIFHLLSSKADLASTVPRKTASFAVDWSDWSNARLDRRSEIFTEGAIRTLGRTEE